jgi:hypothetical protein
VADVKALYAALVRVLNDMRTAQPELVPIADVDVSLHRRTSDRKVLGEPPHRMEIRPDAADGPSRKNSGAVGGRARWRTSLSSCTTGRELLALAGRISGDPSRLASAHSPTSARSWRSETHGIRCAALGRRKTGRVRNQCCERDPLKERPSRVTVLAGGPTAESCPPSLQGDLGRPSERSSDSLLNMEHR